MVCKYSRRLPRTKLYPDIAEVPERLWAGTFQAWLYRVFTAAMNAELAPVRFRSCTRVELDIGPSQESVPEKLTVSVAVAGVKEVVHPGLIEPHCSVMTTPDAVAEMPAALKVGMELINDARLAAIDAGLSLCSTV